MIRRKILIVSRSFYPMNSPRSFRTTELVKEFARQGHEVTLLTLKNDEYHLAFEQKFGVIIKDFGPLTWPVFKAKSSYRLIWLIQRAVERGLQHFAEYPDIELVRRVKNALKDKKNYDLLISIAVPHPVHWGVARARSEEHSIATVWAADCGDPYMGFENDRLNKPFWFAHFEKQFCRKADYITLPIEGAKEAYYDDFRNKIRVIPQGFNFEEVSIDPSEYQKNEVPTFGYAGGLWGGGRNPDELFKYLCSVDKPFKFIIHTNNSAPLTPYINRLNGKLEIHDYISRSQLLKKMAKMDFLVNLENDTAKQQPSKLIDYYLTGRPVLSVPSIGLDTEKVDQFLDGDYSNKYRFKDVDQYRIENVCKKFLALCNSK